MQVIEDSKTSGSEGEAAASSNASGTSEGVVSEGDETDASEGGEGGNGNPLGTVVLASLVIPGAMIVFVFLGFALLKIQQYNSERKMRLTDEAWGEEESGCGVQMMTPSEFSHGHKAFRGGDGGDDGGSALGLGPLGAGGIIVFAEGATAADDYRQARGLPPKLGFTDIDMDGDVKEPL